MGAAVLPPSPLDILAPDGCLCGYAEFCICPSTERALRRVIRDGSVKLNAQQREWCLCEIDKVEGHGRHEYLDADDSTVAAGVFSAWTDYCRDKGLM
jgi:hypothetical protein